jgi:hypothetical protein
MFEFDLDHYIEVLEVTLLEEVAALRECVKGGTMPHARDIAEKYLDPAYGNGGKCLAHQDHNLALACIAALALHWLAHGQEPISDIA